MNYSDIFRNEVEKCEISETYIGTGNPNSKILVVGKETAIDVENKAGLEENHIRFQRELLEDYNTNTKKWNLNIKNQVGLDSLSNWVGGKNSPKDSNPLFPFKSLHPSELKEGHTWRKYQKLHDLIFLNDMSKVKEKEFNFHQNFFLTEMNSSPSKFSKFANKSGIPSRKLFFKESDYFKNFPVVILACSNYINGSEIEDIYKVKFDKQDGIGTQRFWTHYNTEKTILVIHTRQLSTNVTDKLLVDIANEIRGFITYEL